MLYKSFKAGSMQRTRYSLFLLTTFALLISSCQPAPEARVVHQKGTGKVSVADALIAHPSQADPVAAGTELNECLDCHSDKDRLVETAALEEPAEAESKGVG
jgi:hypothetical protein